MRVRILLFGWLALGVGACDVYQSRDGEFSAGGVDVVTFPPPYLGTGGNRTKPGSGSISEARAYVGGQPIGHFIFPYGTTQVGPTVSASVDPLRIIDSGMPNPKLPVPRAYDLSSVGCTPPSNYVWDEQRDEVRYDRQYNIFTTLPSATYNAGALPTWSYVPIVARVPAIGTDGCQDVKSETTLVSTPSIQVSSPDGTYLAWAIIDPDAPVYRVGQTQANSFGWGTQLLGWYNHYLLAYLDGGSIPTQTFPGPIVEITPMALYYPRTPVQGPMFTNPGALGQGYDVVEFQRGQDGYSPVCQVFTYDAMSTFTPAQLPQDANTIKAMFGPSIQADPKTPFTFCLQVQQ
jgi:hypothetical protein